MQSAITEAQVVERIRRHILFAGYSLTEAADEIGMSHTTIYRRINLLRSFTLDEIIALANLCNVDPRMFFAADREGAAARG